MTCSHVWKTVFSQVWIKLYFSSSVIVERISLWNVNVLMSLHMWAFGRMNQNGVYETQWAQVCTQYGCHGNASGGVRDEHSCVPPARDYSLAACGSFKQTNRTIRKKRLKFCIFSIVSVLRAPWRLTWLLTVWDYLLCTGFVWTFLFLSYR